MEYTKGEWKAKRPNLNRPILIYTGDEPTKTSIIARMNERAIDNKTGEIQFNDARLIASAPDLYKACKKIMSASKYWQAETEHIIESAEALNSAVKAIAKVGGK